jgi:uncharacterized protein
MRKFLLLAALIAAPLTASPGVAPLQAQLTVTGSWTGELEVQGMRLPLVFHIGESGGGLTATMDSPLQGARGIPVDSVVVDGTELRLRVLSIGGAYIGRLTAPDVLEGEWRQGGGALPLTLRRGAAASAEPRRPQHPVGPFPYRVEEVRFANEAAGIRLAGTLTLPEGTGPFPAVALVSGSGPQDRDETLLGHKPFLVLADHLTRSGVAVLRYDDRGVGSSEGDFATATTLDLAADAAAAAEYLRSHPAVDRSRVGLVGHSEGGLIAPLVATGAHGVPTADLAFVVLLAGPALRGDEILGLQLRAIAAAGGAAPDQIERSARVQEQLLEIVRTEPDEARRRERLAALVRADLETMTPEARLAQGIPPAQEEAFVAAQAEAAASPWMREFVLLDPRPVLARLRVPALALFGEIDVQVPPRENEPAMREALRDAPDATVITLPGLNHLFQTAVTGFPGEYGALEETFAPEALETITSWILRQRAKR